ncbi:hypothetical protein Misp01_74170 [Microtetraspora sp. NBRC 13810]|nr:hypothetical protein Misp01_74170 [Microtetraspora sp. NBRC 13810]
MLIQPDGAPLPAPMMSLRLPGYTLDLTKRNPLDISPAEDASPILDLGPDALTAPGPPETYQLPNPKM